MRKRTRMIHICADVLLALVPFVVPGVTVGFVMAIIGYIVLKRTAYLHLNRKWISRLCLLGEFSLIGLIVDLIGGSSMIASIVGFGIPAIALVLLCILPDIITPANNHEIAK